MAHKKYKYQLNIGMKHLIFFPHAPEKKTNYNDNKNPLLFPLNCAQIILLSITNQKSKLIVITQMYRLKMDRKHPVIKKWFVFYLPILWLFYSFIFADVSPFVSLQLFISFRAVYGK